MHTSLLIQALEQATRDCLEQARPLLLGIGQRCPTVRIRTDLSGRAAGQMRQDGDGQFEIRYNLGIARLQPEAFMRETVAHEVAHLVTWICHGRRARPHGLEWQSVMHFLGIEAPRRCHEFALPPSRRRQRSWSYHCDCREHALSTTRHNRATKGIHYYCRSCGAALRSGESKRRPSR